MNAIDSVFSWTVEDNIALVTIDVQGESQNTLKAEFAPQMLSVLEAIKAESSVIAVVVQSGKKDSFIAGADIGMLSAAQTEAEIEGISASAHDAFKQLENYPLPVIAAINGACLGGGYEFALACHGRVASDEPVTVFGLPEVQLGVLPAGGGTQRLPRLVGIATALDLMLSGRKVKAVKAKKMGMINEVVPKKLLLQAAKRLAKKLAKAGDHIPTHHNDAGQWLRSLTSIKGIQKLALEENSYGRKVLFDQARKKTLDKTLGNYPAAEKIIDCVAEGIEKGFEKGLEVEKQAFGKLVCSPQARQLMNIFFASTAMKKESGVDSEQAPRSIEQVTVLGGGLMGAGIAFVSADKANKKVRVKDRDDVGVGNALKYSWRLFQNRVKRKSLTRAEAGQRFARITGTTEYSGMKNTDLFIEAVFEDLDLKHKIIKDVQKHGNPDAIFATNTSSIPITDIAKASTKPENVIGLHYFSPVEKMPLLEIIVTEQTSPEVVASCVAFGKEQGKTVIVVNDGPGFYTSRILAPYLNEAGYLMEEGVGIEFLDQALKEFGFPVGPLTLVDEVGIDVGSKIAPILSKAFGERMQPPASYKKLLEDGRLGKKNKKGFYRYTDAKKAKKEADESIYPLLGVSVNNRFSKQEVAERCALQMINEAIYCLQDNILRSPRDGDIGAIFGLGFPPFLGGPFRYADTIGTVALKETMEKYRDKYGLRFEPAPLLVEMATSGKTFYS